MDKRRFYGKSCSQLSADNICGRRPEPRGSVADSQASSSRAPEPDSSDSSSDYSSEEEIDSTESDTETASEVWMPPPSSDSSESEEDGGLEDMLWSKDGKIRWSPTADIMKRHVPPAIPQPGPTRFATARITDIQSAWNLLMTDKIMKEILKNTNLYMQRTPRTQPWKLVEEKELMAFLGLLLLAGVYRSRGEAVRSLWDEKTGRPVFRATMSRNRFEELMQAIRFDDRLTRPRRMKLSKLAAIEPLWGMWVHQLPILFNPGIDITIDEQLLSFRGRCKFRQYMPQKPAKYGLKIWVACDSETSYAFKMEPYTGKLGSEREVGQGQRVVLQLMEGLKGHTVTCDNFFTSYQLGVDLLKKKNAMVGTIRKNKRELPRQLLQIAQRQPQSSLFAHTETHTVVSYMPKKKKNVLVMSTRHREAAVSDEAGQKPTIIMDYNKCKGGVDNLDKVVGCYRSGRRTSRWPLSLFFNMLDVSAYNAYVLWRWVNPQWNVSKTWRRRLFLQELGMALVTPWMAQRQRLPRAPTAAALVREVQAEPEEDEARAVPSQKSRNANRGFCSICKKRVSICCAKCGDHVCKEHWSPVCTPCTDGQ